MKVPFAASALLFACAINAEQQQDSYKEHECRMDAETEGVCQDSTVVVKKKEEQDKDDGPYDDHPSCSHWAQIGECDTNPK